MKRHLVNKFDKKRMPTLPRVVFAGRIETVTTEAVAEKAVDFLLTHPIVGIDTETRPSFTKGRSYKVALLQVSTEEICFLFRLNRLGDSPAVKRLLENKGVAKVGLSLNDDVRALGKRLTFTPGNFIDIQELVPNIGIEDMSLAKIYANIFGERISKREQLSNWEAETLTDKQKLYAATDAWVCINIYKEYMRLMETNDYELEVIVTENENDTAKEG